MISVLTSSVVDRGFDVMISVLTSSVVERGFDVMIILDIIAKWPRHNSQMT